MMHRWVIVAFAWLFLCLMLAAHSQTTLGFPPGTFSSRVPREGGGGGGGGGVSIDVLGPGGSSELYLAGVSSVTAQTIGAFAPTASATALVVTIGTATGGTVPTYTGFTWAGVAMTQINCTINGGIEACVYCLASPTSGNQNIAATWTGGSQTDLFIDAVSFKGTNTVGGTTTCPNGTGNTANATLTITSATGHYVVCSQVGSNNAQSGTPSQLFFDGTNGSAQNGAGAYGTGAATVACGTTGGNNGNQTTAGTDVSN